MKLYSQKEPYHDVMVRGTIVVIIQRGAITRVGDAEQGKSRSAIYQQLSIPDSTNVP